MIRPIDKPRQGVVVGIADAGHDGSAPGEGFVVAHMEQPNKEAICVAGRFLLTLPPVDGPGTAAASTLP
jgi:hypothetical protein